MPTVELEKMNSIAASASRAEINPPLLPLPPEQIEEVRATAQVLAAADPAFREALLKNPGEALGALIAANSNGRYELQRGLQIVAHEASDGVVTLVIPSPDKAVGATGDLAKLSRECGENSAFRAALMASPVQAINEFLGAANDLSARFSADKEVKALLEDAGELLVVVPSASTPSAASIVTDELLADGGAEPHMTCPSCNCPSASYCPSGNCPSAVGCPSYSWNCR